MLSLQTHRQYASHILHKVCIVKRNTNRTINLQNYAHSEKLYVNKELITLSTV
jgi:hypothetical protein